MKTKEVTQKDNVSTENTVKKAIVGGYFGNNKAKTVKNINTGKVIEDRPTQPTPKVVKAPKVIKPTMAGKLDVIITKGGNWETLVDKANKEAKTLGSNLKYSTGTLKAHINYRVKRNPKYLGKLKLTEKGVA